MIIVSPLPFPANPSKEVRDNLSRSLLLKEVFRMYVSRCWSKLDVPLPSRETLLKNSNLHGKRGCRWWSKVSPGHEIDRLVFEITATRYTFNVLTTINRTATFLFVARKRFFSMAADVSRYPEAGCECSWLWKIPARPFGNLKLLKPIISDDYDEKMIRVCTCYADPATAFSLPSQTRSGECLLRPLYT